MSVTIPLEYNRSFFALYIVFNITLISSVALASPKKRLLICIIVVVVVVVEILIIHTRYIFQNLKLPWRSLCNSASYPPLPFTAGCLLVSPFLADSSFAIFDCKHPVDFKRTAVSGRKATGAILAVLMSTTGKNLLGEIT